MSFDEEERKMTFFQKDKKKYEKSYDKYFGEK